jgi:DNA-binding ferritin-like protein (Dps family)
MNNLLTKIIGDKKEWKAMEARARRLPRDYRVVYGEMKSYMWRFTSGDGMDVVAVLKGVLELFETSAAEGRHVLDVTGSDVAAFCDERLRGVTTYADTWRSSLNREVAGQVSAQVSARVAE